MNFKDLEKTIAQLKRTDDEIARISKQVEAVLRDKVTSIELTFKVKQHVEQKAFIDGEGDLRMGDQFTPKLLFYENQSLENTLKKLREEKNTDEVKMSVSDGMFLEIMRIFLEPLKITREGLVIKLKEHGVNFENE